MEYKQVNFDEITEAKKKKKVADSITYSTGYPDWDIAQFNKRMGTGGLGDADQIPHIPNGDTLPNGPVADAVSSDGASDACNGDAGSSAGEGGAMGEGLNEESYINKLTEASEDTAYTFGIYNPLFVKLLNKYSGKNILNKNDIINMAKQQSTVDNDIVIVFEAPLNIIKDTDNKKVLEDGTAIKSFVNGKESTFDFDTEWNKIREDISAKFSNVVNKEISFDNFKAALTELAKSNLTLSGDAGKVNIHILNGYIKAVYSYLQKNNLLDNATEADDKEEKTEENKSEEKPEESKPEQSSGSTNTKLTVEEAKAALEKAYPNNARQIKLVLGMAKKAGIVESLNEENLTEAHLDYYTQLEKMRALENGTRKFNAPAASDEKLEYNWRLCKDENLPYARSVMETEMKRRGGRLAALLKPKANLNVVITEDDITSRGLETVRGLVQPSDLPKYYSFKIAVIHLLFALFSNKTDIANAIRDEILAAWDGINLQQLKDILTNTINNKDVTAKIKNICAGYDESLKEDTVYSHREEKSFKLPNEISLINQKTVEDFIKSLAPEEEFKVGYVTPVYFYKELENLFTLIKATELVGYTGMDYRDVIADKNVVDHSDRVANAQRQIDTYKDGAWGQKLNKEGEKFSTSYRATNKLALNPLKANSADEYEEVTDAAGNIVLDSNGERVYKTDANGEKIVKQHYDLSKILFYPEVGSTPVVHYYLDLRDGQGFRKVKRELLVDHLYTKVMEMAFARDNAVSQADARRVVKYGFKDIKDFANQYPGLTFDNYLKAIKNGEDPAEWNKNHPFSSRWTIGDFTLKVQKMLDQDAATISSAQLKAASGMNRNVTAYEDKPQVRALYSNQVYYLSGRPGTYGKVLSEDLDEGIVFSDNAQRCQIKDLIDSPEGRLILKRLQVGREGNGDSLGFGSYPRYLKADEIEKLKDEWIYYEDSGDCWYARFEKPVNEIRAILGLEPQDEFGRSIKKDESLKLKEAKHYAPTFHIDYTIKGEDWEENIDIEAESETEAIEAIAEKENVAFEDIEVNNCWQWTSDDFARAEDNRKQWDDMFYNEALELKEAKRYVKRYYVRPQNIFCSNKEDILKALIRIGDENCSIYSLKNLGDHDDVHLLKPEDIIYYYDDHVLYDKNHVQVMDYDLFVKHEEERKKYANIDAASDADFNQEYDDRLTTASLKDKEAVANYRAINKKDIK